MRRIDFGCWLRTGLGAALLGAAVVCSANPRQAMHQQGLLLAQQQTAVARSDGDRLQALLQQAAGPGTLWLSRVVAGQELAGTLSESQGAMEMMHV